MSGRIGQIFVNDDKVTTYLCINNYPSFFCPEEARTLQMNVQLHNDSGEVIYNGMHEVAPHGSASLHVGDLLGQNECRYGMATCDFGVGNTHFFTYYLNRENQAMAIIHPQSTVGQETQGNAWRSCQGISTEGLKSLRIYHANHSKLTADIHYSLSDFHGDEVVATEGTTIAPISANYVEFTLENRGQLPKVLSLKTDKLPSPNGKALIMREYDNNRFSMSHG
ncbi:hypothetical protein MRY87_09755 [bacterium]|nr:hypothetical protein [bacterium]